MKFRIGRKKGDDSTVRIVRRINGDFYGIFGTVADLLKKEMILSEYPDNVERWLLIVGTDGMTVHQFEDRASVKEYLEGMK